MICSQLYELDEAVLSTRDAILTSDDVSQSVSRTLKFKNSGDNDKRKDSYVGLVENMEKKFKLISKLKNHIIHKTLQYGKYYAYTIPYSELFTRYYQSKVKSQLKGGGSTYTLESASDDFIKSFRDEAHIVTPIGSIKQNFNKYIENIEIYNDETAIPVVEGVELAELIDNEAFKKQADINIKKAEKNSRNKKQTVFADGIIDPNNKDMDFSAIKGCYVKLIDPRKIIPVQILDQVIGYYYIHDTNIEINKSPFTTTIKINPQNNTGDVENMFLSKVTEKIVKAFDKKFLENNSKFKELILNALTYNDLYKKQIKFQFIPIDYMTEFTINQDEEGNGTSVLIKSLFYAKLYLALLIFKMMTIISKSNDTKIYYVKQSGLDANVVNKVQEVARTVKDRQINFMDLLNYNSMISKIGANKEIFMPVGRSGEHGIDFDILAGQDVQLNTDLMDMLRTGFISATGVPSVIMNYINEADYAKTLVMANAKFVGRVVNNQLDFNDSITEFYKKIIKFSTDIPVEMISEFEFVLNPPKSLNNMNMSDLVSNADSSITFMIKAKTGENASPSESDNKVKDLVYNQMAREFLPMLPWNTIDQVFDDAMVELQKILANKKMNGDSDAEQ
jgi:hypothetical protein